MLMVSALIMAGLLLWLFLDTSTQIATYFSQAVSAGGSASGGNTTFKIVEAGQLNFRGLADPSSVPEQGVVTSPVQPEVIVPSLTPSIIP